MDLGAWSRYRSKLHCPLELTSHHTNRLDKCQYAEGRNKSDQYGVITLGDFVRQAKIRTCRLSVKPFFSELGDIRGSPSQSFFYNAVNVRQVIKIAEQWCSLCTTDGVKLFPCFDLDFGKFGDSKDQSKKHIGSGCTCQNVLSYRNMARVRSR